ncbi:MAG: response regulator transcription factor [Bacteroidota bacterium]
MIKIALADDHVVLRKSLAVIIGLLDDCEVVCEASNGISLLDQLKQSELPDIILLDITMPLMDGLETAKKLKQQHPSIKILALTMIKSEPVIMEMIKNGVRGYLLKDCEIRELEKAIHALQQQGYYYNEYITPRMIPKSHAKGKIVLNSRELSFLRWCCTELTQKEIANEMMVSPRTVDDYRDNLFKKLEVNSRVGLVIYAIKNGFVQV